MSNLRRRTSRAFPLVAICLLTAWTGCGERVPPRVAVDAAVDKEIALPIFADFSKRAGVDVHSKYGIETGGRDVPEEDKNAKPKLSHCDVYWSDDIRQTLALDRAGLLRPYSSTVANSVANEFPPSARSPRNTWCAIATDARVLVVNTHQIAESRRPTSIHDLKDPQWYERAGIAKPLSGHSATHAACLFQAWGDAKATEFFEGVKRNARILLSDHDVAHAVASGSLAFGLTSASDAVAELAAEAPVTIIYPDQDEYGLGTLFIPMTIALIKDSPNPEQGEQLLTDLLSAEVARQLANEPNALMPLRAGVAASDRVKTPDEVRTMSVDFPTVAERWDATAKILGELFAAP